MSNKNQLLNHNERLASIIQTLQGKSVPGSVGSLETGTLPTVTSYIATYSDYYVDLESIPGIESKLLVVLQFVDSSRKNPAWILTRSSPEQNFSLSAISGNDNFTQNTILNGYVFGFTQCLTTVGELTYYAA